LINIYLSTAGSVYVYGAVGNVWSRQSKILAADGVASDFFGRGVSIYGTAAMIGANRDDNNAGKSFFFFFFFVKLF
jgi:hypothetical protein